MGASRSTQGRHAARPMILATAGHIDHGKTALIRALTGVDADRLPEEKRRGLTIDLGFAYATLPDGAELGNQGGDIEGLVDRVAGAKIFVKRA